MRSGARLDQRVVGGRIEKRHPLIARTVIYAGDARDQRNITRPADLSPAAEHLTGDVCHE